MRTGHQPARIVVLISGSGSNLQALINHLPGETARIAAVISNRPDVFGLERARREGIPGVVLDHTSFTDRAEFDARLAELIHAFSPDVIVLAGFMRILTEEFVSQFEGRMVNIHPALLPEFKGLNTHQRALESGATEHGCTVHFVTPELDDGPNIIQARVTIKPDDDPKTLALKVQQKEHIIYPMAVEWLASGRLKMISRKAYLDDRVLESSGFILPDN